jgi:hypothetical protein
MTHPKQGLTSLDPQALSGRTEATKPSPTCSYWSPVRPPGSRHGQPVGEGGDPRYGSELGGAGSSSDLETPAHPLSEPQSADRPPTSP